MPNLRLRSVVLDAPDVRALAGFYQRLLGWAVTSDEDDPTWVRLQPPGGGTGLAVQEEPEFVAPVWPGERGSPQMQLHLDLQVDDLAAACTHAEECGGRLAPFQPQDDVRVYLDPVGHPFCLFVN
jgi:catechol 2,3-dioxygenase-like lactoylglutathione lyase family enzyme